MKEIIKQLYSLRVQVTSEMHSNCQATAYRDGTKKYEHGSHEQTRDMLLRSMFAQSVAGINAAILQLEIIEKEIY